MKNKQKHKLKIKFLGGAETVTGSKFLLTIDNTNILIDCGLFQGLKKLRLQNWTKPDFDVTSLDAVVLTHAHIDHSGYLPRLIKDGFRGTIHVTHATKDLLKILLPDSARLQEEASIYANQKGFSKHHPAMPLYTEDDANRSLHHLKGHLFFNQFEIKNAHCHFFPAGHILGAASIAIKTTYGILIFSGDLGRPNDLLMPEPSKMPKADWIIMESTYGDRIHMEESPETELIKIIKPVLKNNGTVLIPAFAVGRCQTLLYAISKLIENKQLPKVPIYINSPMATSVTTLYQKHIEDHRLSRDECQKLSASAIFVRSVEESKSLNSKTGPMIIISASGMISGGRILHHMEAFAPHPQNLILLVGYQAPGTRGSSLLSGSRNIKLHGHYLGVRAQVHHLDTFSAHADQNDLLDWLGNAPKIPKRVYLVHGEPQASDNLRVKIKDQFHYDVEVAQMNQTVDLLEDNSKET